MVKFYKPSRVAALFIVMGLLTAIYMLTLYRLQLFDTNADAYAALARKTTTQEVTLAADRGDILDRNGVVLVSTRAAYNITLSRDKLLKRDDINEIILKLVHTAIDNGVSYTDTFPVTTGAPFAYLSDMTTSQRNLLNAYFDYFEELDPGISASDLIVWMKKHYGIDYTTNISDARLIIGVRYEMEIRAIVYTNPYVFASDVSSDFLSLIKEAQLPGVNVEPSAVRVYHTPYAAHLLGHIGKMTKEQYEKYKELGYSYNSIVGQSGVELAFEEYLHGTDGVQYITTSDKDGTVLDVYTDKKPTPGQNVFLSIDIGLQAVCENSLAAKIDLINSEREEEDRVTGGAVVVSDVNTGEVLALCSYPTYDLANYSKIIGDLLNNKNTPLVNRATTGLYNPGSTFKMITALAGLKNGVISPSTLINDTGVYMKYADKDFKPVCWIYSNTGHGHGPENVVTALRDSCNYFFYEVADNLGINKISETAADFGLGSKTGIELSEKAGVLATPANKEELFGQVWYSANTIISAIGQDINYFTPIQLANYVATIANGGTRYSMTVLNHIRSADYTSVVHTPERKVLGQVAGSEYLRVIQEGMKLVASDGTAKSVFRNYPIPVAAKTGTVQSVHTMGKAALNTGVFVCYAPANNPEIAISLVVEKGTSGSTIMEIARDIMDYYFDDRPSVTVAEDNTLLP
jgi:penicillin-binding protein 2